MSERINAKGRCLCGTVQVTAQTMSTKLGACHCGMCRKWTGGPFLAVDCGTEVTFQGQDHVGVFSSSEWGERGFCQKCGTHLFYRLKGKNHYIMPAGLFDGVDEFQFSHQVFIDNKPAYYDFANETKTMTEAQVFAQFRQG